MYRQRAIGKLPAWVRIQKGGSSYTQLSTTRPKMWPAIQRSHTVTLRRQHKPAPTMVGFSANAPFRTLVPTRKVGCCQILPLSFHPTARSVTECSLAATTTLSGEQSSVVL